MIRSRLAYTLTELLIVVVIVGSLTLFAIPKFTVLVDRNNMTAAREEITSAIATARAAAVQKGRTASVQINNNNIRVTAVTAGGGATTTVIALKSLNTLYKVSVVAVTDTMITYDMRGFASPRLSAIARFRIVKGTRKDSVCVTTAGQIMPRGCAL